MKRGEIWTVAAGSGYSGKPRPAVVIQDERFDRTDSIAVCPLTTTLIDTTVAGLSAVRPQLAPSESNGLREPSQIMVDKLVSIRTEKLGSLIGNLSDADIQELDDALLMFLGLARRAAIHGQLDR